MMVHNQPDKSKDDHSVTSLDEFRERAIQKGKFPKREPITDAHHTAIQYALNFKKQADPDRQNTQRQSSYLFPNNLLVALEFSVVAAYKNANLTLVTHKLGPIKKDHHRADIQKYRVQAANHDSELDEFLVEIVAREANALDIIDDNTDHGVHKNHSAIIYEVYFAGYDDPDPIEYTNIDDLVAEVTARILQEHPSILHIEGPPKLKLLADRRQNTSTGSQINASHKKIFDPDARAYLEEIVQKLNKNGIDAVSKPLSRGSDQEIFSVFKTHDNSPMTPLFGVSVNGLKPDAHNACTVFHNEYDTQTGKMKIDKKTMQPIRHKKTFVTNNRGHANEETARQQMIDYITKTMDDFIIAHNSNDLPHQTWPTLENEEPG